MAEDNWRKTQHDIDVLVDSHNKSYVETNQIVEITKRHWCPSASAEQCMNQSCMKKFTLLERKSHCRRCGKVFCRDCTKEKKRLNTLAHLDPNGRLYKVCVCCFKNAVDEQSIGQTRDLLPMFHNQSGSMVEPDRHTVMRGYTRKTHKTNFKLSDECSRLLQGYKDYLKANEVKKLFVNVKYLVKYPQWMISPHATIENLQKSCSQCCYAFYVMSKRYNCCVCGVLTCSSRSCSADDLLLYKDNETKGSITPPFSQDDINMGIIKFVGCPEKEPTVCMYARICKCCKDKLAHKQVLLYKQAKMETPSVSEELEEDLWVVIERIREKLERSQHLINTHLPKYQEMIESLEISPKSKSHLPQAKSNTQLLAKAQTDMMDHFNQYIIILQNVKRLKPKTNIQIRIVRNFFKSKCAFYHENVYIFRQHRRKLEETVPKEVIQCIQQTVDNHVITGTHLSIKQLAFEVLRLCDTHKIQDSLTIRLIEVETVAVQECEKSVIKCGEDWVKHQKNLNILLNENLQHDRFIRTSRRLTKQLGSLHVQNIIAERCIVLLEQIYQKLVKDTADISFNLTKQGIEKLVKNLKAISIKDKDFIFDKVETKNNTLTKK